MLDVLVATIDESRTPGGLEHIGQPFRLLVDTSKGWANAANTLLDQAKGDALFLDDDVTLTASTLALLPAYYDKADIFGFTLVSPGEGWNASWRVVSAGFGLDSANNTRPASDIREVMTPAYVAHVTASALYIKAHVLRAGLRFPIWPGAHYEDVAFTVEAWIRGFKVAYLPGLIEHPLTAAGAGKTKSAEDNFNRRRAQNEALYKAWMDDKDLSLVPRQRMPIE